MGWAIQVAEKMGIRRASFWPASALALASMLNFHKLIDDGIINHSGVPLNDNTTQPSPTMPPIKPANLSWGCIGDLATTRSKLPRLPQWRNGYYATQVITWRLQRVAIFRSCCQLTSNRLAEQAGHFWPEDSTCLSWLDQQPACSVIYIAFGSFTILDQAHFEELPSSSTASPPTTTTDRQKKISLKLTVTATDRQKKISLKLTVTTTRII
ncbi:UDP-glucuronosyl/UDP-glucosyltransferase [Cynara cardunculus var. scolymus]|uniref:UDP-glucuronosyl/UDP-glucosyltransferase n=1 Tax=Cynara cardunculus var. scolymus TaxID=59895 RepID=A0A103YHA8_CYNCS|nr:UDP-glucuronosyl/UDP-glucosyltransferase [Cynara cardunculus var. scolymus]